MSGRRTETTVRHYDESGELLSETTTIVTTTLPDPADEPPGMYL